MNRKTRPKANHGFTLIELILTLTLATLMGSILLPFLTGNLARSSQPLFHLQEILAVQTVLENMLADCNRKKTAALPQKVKLSALRDAIGGAGSSRANPYGKYQVMHNHFVCFDAHTRQEIPCGQEQDLKVTIRDPQGAELTTIFSQ